MSGRRGSAIGATTAKPRVRVDHGKNPAFAGFLSKSRTANPRMREAAIALGSAGRTYWVRLKNTDQVFGEVSSNWNTSRSPSLSTSSN